MFLSVQSGVKKCLYASNSIGCLRSTYRYL